MERWLSRNVPSLTEDEQSALASSSAAVIGCGGLGGSVIELLARTGIGAITAVDPDVFEETNLNRQLLSTRATLGTSKADAACRRMRDIDPNIRAVAIKARLDEKNARDIVRGHGVVIDALDTFAARLTLEAACADEGITLVHGAILEWQAQVAVIAPGSGALSRLYEGAPDEPASKSTLSFVPAFCASLQVCEAVKVLVGRAPISSSSLLIADLRFAAFDLIPL